jgi:hypothetical protein
MFQNTTHSSDAYMPHEQEMGNNAQAIAIHGGSRKRKMTDDSAFVSMSSSDEITPPMETLAQRRKVRFALDVDASNALLLADLPSRY